MMGISHWRYRRFHVSYLFGWLALGVLVGLLLAKLTQLTVSPVGLVIFAILTLPALKSRRWWAILIVIVMGVVFGLARGGDYSSQTAKYNELIGVQTTISGVIATDPQQSGKGSQTFQLGGVKTGSVRLPGELYISTISKSEMKRGDMVAIKGKLKEGFATYPATMSFAEATSISRSPNIIREVRERFIESVRTNVVEPMASLGIGFVVGQRTSLPPDLDEQLKIVGLTHIVVASGYNLTILVRFARRLLARHSRYLAFVLSIALMLTFVAFSGFSPSMNRAVAVTGLSLLAWYYGRRFHPLLLIMYVAAGTALWNPVYVWADLGWYLSFFAFGGVLLIAPLISAQLFKDKSPPAVSQLVIETLSAELMTLPLIAFIFGIFPTFGLLANVLVGPVIPFAMLATTSAGIVGVVFPILAPFAAVPATVTIGYVIAVVEWLSSVDWAQLHAAATLPVVIVWFVAVLVWSIYIWHRSGYNFRSSAITD